MSPAVATTFMLKCYEYCFAPFQTIHNLLVLYNATFVQSKLTDAELEYAHVFRSQKPASELDLQDERMLYIMLINILSM